ncbi:MAG: YihY/virulence factor BrkB family protein [Isosphaeraceae bacterium]|nr:YihY/virulence factor BrkB family protein [Isosphaeraceae bacterium]
MFPPLRLRAALSLGGLSVYEVVSRTWRQGNRNEVMTRAAAVSFYAMLASVPFLAFLLTLVVQLLPDLTRQAGGAGDTAKTVEKLETTLQAFLPEEAYTIVRDQIIRLQGQMRKQPPILLLVSSIAVTLWLASSLFLAIIDALDKIYGVEETRSLVKLRLTAILMTVLQAVILVGSLIAIVAGPEILQWLGLRGPEAQVATAIQWLVVVVMVLLSFALTFYIGPDADQRWEWITPGSLVGTIIFLGFCGLFRVYVQNFANYEATYGSLGGVMVLLFWFWVSSLVLLLGAQMNKVIEDASPLGKNVGQKVDPTEPPKLEAVAPKPLEEGTQ